MSLSPGIALRDVCFSYGTSSEPILTDVSVHFPMGFTGIVGPNGAGKTTLLQLIAGMISPDSGSVTGCAGAVYCEQRTDQSPVLLPDLLEDLDGEAFRIRGMLDIQDDYALRWSSLSHGERKRAQIACALWQRPSLLALDEPTNHIDAATRDLLLASLERYRGVGLIVSHDRTLLDDLCEQCLWLESSGARLYPGGYSKAHGQKQLNRETAVRARAKAAKVNKKLHSEMVNRRQHAAKEHSVRSKRGLSPKDSDAREKIDRARVTDSKAGKDLRQLDGRLAQASRQLETAVVEKEYETGIWLPGSRSRRSLLFRLEAGSIALNKRRRLAFPALQMQAEDRVAITGVNGAGKSTLLRTIVDSLRIPHEHVILMPQEITAAHGANILAEVRSLPGQALGQVMTIVSRLGSRPHRLLDSAQLSPGELRKVVLALGIMREPHLIVMDEPTNHLDLPSIEAIESALAQCPCGLLVISHDQHFLDRIHTKRWNIEQLEFGHAQLVVL
jgi:macrolide transport system ATP-binding/permease protein